MRVVTRRRLLSFAAGAATVGVALPAGADVAKVRVEVMVIHATKGPAPGFYDPRIGDVDNLKKPPFDSFNTYRLLDKPVFELEAGKSAPTKLPNGRTLQIAYSGPTPERRHDVSASISQPDGNSYLRLLRVSAPIGQTYYVAGQSYQGGNLVLAITLR